MTTEGKFKTGAIVCEKVRPAQKMIVERYSDRIYYCKLQEAPHRKAVVYVERDLFSVDVLFGSLKGEIKNH